jgi:hypothetical protein
MECIKARVAALHMGCDSVSTVVRMGSRAKDRCLMLISMWAANTHAPFIAAEDQDLLGNCEELSWQVCTRSNRPLSLLG